MERLESDERQRRAEGVLRFVLLEVGVGVPFLTPRSAILLDPFPSLLLLPSPPAGPVRTSPGV